MLCLMCGKSTRCSCKWGWCPKCNSTNKQISLMNDLIKLWLSKEIVKDRLKDIHSYTGKVDSYTLYEFLTNQIDEEKFNEQIENYKTKQQELKVPSIYASIPNWDWINPNKQCVYRKPWVWERCIYCNWIKKFQWDKVCPAYKEKEEKKE